MARMIPLYSLSSHAEIERHARMVFVFEIEGQPRGCGLEHCLQAEAEFVQSSQLNQWRPTLAKSSSLSPPIT